LDRHRVVQVAFGDAAAYAMWAGTAPPPAAAGERAALDAIEVYRGWLARGIAALAVAHGVDRVVVGGGPAGPEAPWWPGLEELVGARLWPSHVLTVGPSALGDAAATVGLAQLASMAS
jgi:predicted NBD/HSP70 family sugar kinase